MLIFNHPFIFKRDTGFIGLFHVSLVTLNNVCTFHETIFLELTNQCLLQAEASGAAEEAVVAGVDSHLEEDEGDFHLGAEDLIAVAADEGDFEAASQISCLVVNRHQRIH